jgi:hypothetical protein
MVLACRASAFPVGLQDDGHSGVNRLHECIRLRRYDREPGLEYTIIVIFLPYTRESKEATVFADNTVRGFLAIWQGLPFVETIRRDEASAFSQVPLERVLVSQRLRAR